MKRVFGNSWIDQTEAINKNRNLINGVIKKREEQSRLLANSQLYNMKILPDLKSSFKPITQSAIIKPIAETATSKLLEDVFAQSLYKNDMFKDVFSVKDYSHKPLINRLEVNSLLLDKKYQTLLNSSLIKPNIPTSNFKAVNLYKGTLLEVSKINLINPVLEQLKNTNFDYISEKLSESQRQFDKSLEKYDDLYWAVDEELWAALRSGRCSEETIAEYVEENIGDYSNFFSSEEYYNPYSLIIEQAIDSLKQEQYASATFNLFAVIDGSITKAFREYEMEIEQRKNRHRNPKTFDKLKHYIQVGDNQDRLAFSFIFFKRVFNVYSVFFKPAWNGKSDVINRNLVMHGSYDYNEITKEDVLKLLQLVKATSILENITFEKEKIIS